MSSVNQNFQYGLWPTNVARRFAKNTAYDALGQTFAGFPPTLALPTRSDKAACEGRLRCGLWPQIFIGDIRF
jgi:hypothetical protein